MAWLCDIPTEFQVHLTFSFIYSCNNSGTYQNKWFSSNSWGLNKTPFPLFLMGNIKLDEIPRKLRKKYVTVLYCISNFAGASYKKLRDTATSPFISWCFTPAKNFIHHYQKKKFCYEFLFFSWIHPNPHAPTYWQSKSTKWDNFFLDAL